MNRQAYFENENYLDFKTGYPERSVDWFKDNILPHLKPHLSYDKKLLDVGCASGYFSNIISNYTIVDGCDFAHNRIEQAKIQFPHINFYQKDLTSDDFSLPIKYDLFFSNAVIPHIPVDRKPKVFANLASVANPNAKLILYDQLINTGVIDAFVGLFSLDWLRDNAPQWEIVSNRNICTFTDEIILKLKV